MDYFSNKLIQALLQEIVLQNLDKIGQELRQLWTKLCKHKNIHNVQKTHSKRVLGPPSSFHGTKLGLTVMAIWVAHFANKFRCSEMRALLRRTGLRSILQHFRWSYSSLPVRGIPSLLWDSPLLTPAAPRPAYLCRHCEVVLRRRKQRFLIIKPEV